MLAALMLTAAITTSAYDFKVGNLCYSNNSDGTTVYVTFEYSGNPHYASLSGDINIPSTVTYNGVTYTVIGIGGYAFENCTGFRSVIIPNSVTSIGKGSFKNCTGLKNVTIGNSVTTIGENAFDGCTCMTSMTMGNSVAKISDYAFNDCSGLTSLNIPNSVITIGSHAFSYCEGLTSVSIGKSVTTMGTRAFDYCSGLTRVNITDLAAWCKIQFDRFSNPLIHAQHLYLNGTEVKDLVVPATVTAIKSETFYNCSGLKSVTIPKSVTSIGNTSFYGCTGLANIYCMAKNPPSIYSQTFGNVNKQSCKLHVLEGCFGAYHAANYWSEFSSIIEDLHDSLVGDVNSDNEVGISDVTLLVNLLLTGRSNSRSDVNGDGETGVADLTKLVGILLEQ